MNRPDFASQLEADLRLMEVPEDMGTVNPFPHVEPVGILENELARKYHLLALRFSRETAKAYRAKNNAVGNLLQLQRDICEAWAALLTYQDLGLLGQAVGKPLVFGKWEVVIKPFPDFLPAGRLDMHAKS